MRLKAYYTTTATIFLLIGVMHAVRFVLGWSAVVAGVVIPLWVSVGAAIIAFYLSFRGYYFRRQCE